MKAPCVPNAGANKIRQCSCCVNGSNSDRVAWNLPSLSFKHSKKGSYRVAKNSKSFSEKRPFVQWEAHADPAFSSFFKSSVTGN